MPLHADHSACNHLQSHKRGQTTAVVDVDDMYIMGRQKSDDSWNEPETWSSARRACGALAESYFASGYDVFVVEGGDRGCIAFVASVHAGSNAKNTAEAEAKKRGEDPADADRASWHAREVAVGEMPVIDNP